MNEHPYDSLTPDMVIDAVEYTGRLCDMRLLALNSYENRVYQVGIEDGEPLVAKFYRPGRWSDAQIREEHSFSAELAAAEVSVVAPLADEGGEGVLQIEVEVLSIFDDEHERVAEAAYRSTDPELDVVAHARETAHFMIALGAADASGQPGFQEHGDPFVVPAG